MTRITSAVGVRLVYQPLHFIRKVPRGAVLGHLHVPPARLRFDKEKEIARAIALVFIHHSAVADPAGRAAGAGSL